LILWMFSLYLSRKASVMKILHLAAECYPAAKAGGLGDVVGALPKYLVKAGHQVRVMIPAYRLPWMAQQEFEHRWSGLVRLGAVKVPVHLVQLKESTLGFDFWMVDIPGLFDRPGIYADPQSGYGYSDETERYLVFQQAILQYLIETGDLPEVIHCHDHHTGLVPLCSSIVRNTAAFKTYPPFSPFTMGNTMAPSPGARPGCSHGTTLMPTDCSIGQG
jgi:starch synthase